MNFYDAVYRITLAQRTSMEKLSISLGKSPNYISASKSRGSSPKVDSAAMILKGCGYSLCAVPKDKVPDNAMVFDKPIEE